MSGVAALNPAVPKPLHVLRRYRFTMARRRVAKDLKFYGAPMRECGIDTLHLPWDA